MLVFVWRPFHWKYGSSFTNKPHLLEVRQRKTGRLLWWRFRENNLREKAIIPGNSYGKFVIWLRSSNASRFLRVNDNHLGTLDYKRFNSLGSAWPSNKTTRRKQLSFNNSSNPRLGCWMGCIHVLVSGSEHWFGLRSCISMDKSFLPRYFV